MQSQAPSPTSHYAVLATLLTLAAVSFGFAIWVPFSGVTHLMRERISGGVGLSLLGFLLIAAAVVVHRYRGRHVDLISSIDAIDLEVDPHPVVCGEQATVTVDITPNSPVELQQVEVVVKAYEIIRRTNTATVGSPKGQDTHWAGTTTKQCGESFDDALERGESTSLEFEIETPETFADCDSTEMLEIDSATGEYLGTEPPDWYQNIDNLRWMISVRLESTDGGLMPCSEQIDGDLTPLVEQFDAKDES
jgi:hypothetical protein